MIALLLLAPIVSEVLFGATRVSVLPVLIPQVATWGCGALIIRDMVRRRRRGWVSLLLLGTALAVAEECVIQQTSLAPLPPGGNNYGRAWGVNWVYFLWALGYESVWVVVLPVQLAELIFPSRRDEAWVGRRGLILAGCAFFLGSLAAWYSWTQVARVQVFHMPEYQPPALYVLMAIAAIGLLVAAAFSRWTAPRPGRSGSARSAPTPRILAWSAFAMGLPWSVLVLLAYGAAPAVPPGIPLTVGVGWIGITLILFTRWTSSPTWNDRHRLAVVFGGVMACMAGGFAIFAVGGALPIDWIGKAILNVLAVVLLARLGTNLRSDRRAIPSVLDAYIAGLKTHDINRIAATVSDDLAFVTPARTLDKEQFLAMLRALYAGFPDWHYDHDEPEWRGDAIAVRWRQGGTHTGTFAWPGLEPVPATGRTVTIPEHFFFYRVAGDMLVEIRPDPVPGGAPRGILEQIGVERPPL